MPLIRLSVHPETGRAALHASPQSPVAALRRAASGHGPIIIMVHGDKYDPTQAATCPHRKIFNAKNGWPAALHATDNQALGIAFGWRARGPLRDVFNAAGLLGKELAEIVGKLCQAAPHRPLHLIAHSMGAEVALAALCQSPAGSISRVILLTAASFQSHAALALSSPAGCRAELINVVSRENDLFDFAIERLVSGINDIDRTLGHGLVASNALTVQLDCPATLLALTRLNVPIAPSRRRVCHWSGYTRPGALAFYARLMQSPSALPLSTLREALPTGAAPRWSRLSLAAVAKRRIMARV